MPFDGILIVLLVILFLNMPPLARYAKRKIKYANWKMILRMPEILIRRLASYRKKTWDIGDYPIQMLRVKAVGNDGSRFAARILQWPTMIATGGTRQEAREGLRVRLKEFSKTEPLIRPGVKVPVRLASTLQLDRNYGIWIDFYNKVLSRYLGNPRFLFVSDDSDLRNFEPLDEEKAKIRREEVIKITLEQFGVDITDQYDKRLYEVMEYVKLKSFEGAGAVLEFIIDGESFSDMSGFYSEVERKLTQGFKMGRNLDAFEDVLRGGFGLFHPGEKTRLIWKNSEKSKTDLGIAETIKYLEERIRIVPFGNRASLRKKISLVKKGVGTTLFELIVRIIGDHSDIELVLN